jgi:hypothetical protein
LLAQPAQPHSDPVAIESEWHKAEGKYGGARQEILDKIEIVWPSGQKETLSTLPGDSICTVVEGEGVRKRSQFEKNTMQTP